MGHLGMGQQPFVRLEVARTDSFGWETSDIHVNNYGSAISAHMSPAVQQMDEGQTRVIPLLFKKNA